MEFHLLSYFIIFLIANFLINIALASKVVLKKTTLDSPGIKMIMFAQSIIMFVFIILITRKVIKSGWKA